MSASSPWWTERVECEITDRHVTIVETRPPWDGRGDPTHFHVARLRYTAATGLWRLYSPDYVADSGDKIFFG